MRSRADLTRLALRAALLVRRRSDHGPSDAVCPFDLAERLGIEVRFVDIGSLEGVYLRRSPPIILLTAYRPPGRQGFTCAHELGHDIFKHGTRIDELVSGAPRRQRIPPEEAIADAFASFLLMPRSAVIHGFVNRGWDPRICRPEQIYVVAHWLGVGYATLVTQMQFTLRLLDASNAATLLRIPLKEIRREMVGQDVDHDLIPVDTHWTGRAIDAQQGDLILLPPDTRIEGHCLALVRDTAQGQLCHASQPGQERVYQPSIEWASVVRVSRRAYVGRNLFRFVEEVADE